MVETGDECVVEGGVMGSSSHEGHQSGLAGIVGGWVTGGQDASVLLEAVVPPVELLQHVENYAKVELKVDNVGPAMVRPSALVTIKRSSCDGSNGSSNSSNNGGSLSPNVIISSSYG